MLLRSGVTKSERYPKILYTESKVTNKSVIMTESNDVNIIAFDPTDGMLIDKWLNYFDKVCMQKKFCDEWKVNNISRYLKGNALTIFVNNCLGCTNYDEIKQILQENFLKVTETTFSEFTNLKLESMSQLEEYFHKKLNLGRNLQLTEDLILQGLTDGLKPEYKNILVTNPPQNSIDWYKVVSKLVPVTTSGISQVKTFSEGSRSRITSPHFATPRHWVRPPPSQAQNFSSGQRGFAPRAPFLHYQQKYPPRPCRICTNRGMINAFHWKRECNYNQQNTSNNA